MIINILMLILVSLTWFISALPFVIPYHLFLRFKSKKLGYKIPFAHLLVAYIFVYFITVILGLTGIPSIGDIVSNRFGIFTPDGLKIPADEINYIPFYWISAGIRTYVENILLFVPLGFLLPCVQRKYEAMGKTVLYGFTLSFIIELSQLFNRRVTDIDDLIMNTVGTFIGVFLFKLVKKHSVILREKVFIPNAESWKDLPLSGGEGWFYMFSTFAGMFLVYYPIF